MTTSMMLVRLLKTARKIVRAVTHGIASGEMLRNRDQGLEMAIVDGIVYERSNKWGPQQEIASRSLVLIKSDNWPRMRHRKNLMRKWRGNVKGEISVKVEERDGSHLKCSHQTKASSERFVTC